MKGKEKMVSHIRGRLSTEPANIEDLLTDIKRGEVKVPKFQRPFVWKPQQALDLLDSLASGYPVGSVLLWRTVEKLRAERNIGDFGLPQTDDMTPTKYVLDGQQRLTVMYSSLGARPNDPGFSPYYDLEKEQFLEVAPSQQVHLFPLRLTYRTTELLNFRTALQSSTNHALYQERLDKLIGAITGYRMPVVELRDLTVEEVCPIFERINSSGTRLSTFDLIAAATWTQEFDLSEEAEEIAIAIQPKGFEGISKETILKCVAAHLLSSVKKEDVMTLRARPKADIVKATSAVKNGLLQAVDLLSSDFHIGSMSFLPYEAQLICLVSFFSSGGALNAASMSRMRQWFWRTSFSQHYRGASEAFISQSLKSVGIWIATSEGTSDAFGMAPSTDKIVGESFHFRGATSKAFVLALARRAPRNLISGAAIDIGDALSVYNKRQFHHIFPQAWLKSIGVETNINSLANICMLSATENNKISDSNPHEYLPRCIEGLAGEADAVLKSSLFPLPKEMDYGSCSFRDFLEARGALLAGHIRSLCSGKS